MADVISLEARRTEKALQKGQKNEPVVELVVIYVELLLQRLLYQKMLSESKMPNLKNSKIFF